MQKIPAYMKKQVETIFGPYDGFEPTEYDWIFRGVGASGTGWVEEGIMGSFSVRVRYTPKDTA